MPAKLKTSQKGSSSKIIIISIVGGFVVLSTFIILSLMLLNFLFSGESSSSTSSHLSDEQALIDGEHDFQKGETATFGSFTVKVNSVERNFTMNGVDSIDRTKEYVKINLSITNTNTIDEYSPLFYITAEGQRGESITSAQIDQELVQGNVATNATVSGNLVFLVNADSNNLKLEYSMPLHSSSWWSQGEKLIFTLEI